MLISLYRKPLHSALGKIWGFSLGSVVKNLPANAGDAGSIPVSGRSPGEENDNPARRAWQATVRGVAGESDTV